MSSARPIDLYRQFIEGGSYDIHTASESTKRQLDKVFTPAERDMHVYKGMVIYEDDANMSGMQHAIESYSSTSESRRTAVDYADRAFDLQDEWEMGHTGVIDKPVTPLIVNLTIKKGTPIADARKLLGSGGMRQFEKEITVGRKVQYSYSNLRRVGDYWQVDAVVRRR